eukprot:TRINITY_DN2261_c0_g1_i4.p1 TRINITY_DN2261_c0_g1~~TRINITY_DN2261_c0_g1_i4.p1  ORF type:complete len:329 (+),score=32.76 TRINITY_DN2261_c0_g1_i4:103-1089(+)
MKKLSSSYCVLLAMSIAIVFSLLLNVVYIEKGKEERKTENKEIETAMKLLLERIGHLHRHKIKTLRNPSKAHDITERNLYSRAQQRLLHLFDEQVNEPSNIVPDDVHQFTTKEFPGYETSNVFFLKYPKTLVQRHQYNDLCFMLAPAVVQHYRIISDGEHETPMVDIKKYIQNHFNAFQRERYLFEDAGIPSHFILVGFIEGILWLSTSDTHLDNFHRCGVGMVSQFEVYEDFTNINVHKHYGNHSGTFKGLHSMAFVGYRKDKDGNVFYLLQNWWKKKQFVEIDDEYLRLSGADIYFIETPQTCVPRNYSQQTGKFIEPERIDILKI